MALSEKERLPPEPRLQGAPGFADQLEQNRATKEPKPEAHATPHGIQPPKDALWEMQVLREHWEDVLKNGPSDQSGKRYGMPIEKAKDEVLKELKVRKQ
jgi:hypothetical protein